MDLKSIPFFTDDITLVPHSATEARHIGRPVTIREFCTRGATQLPCSLYENEDNGELRVELGRLDSMGCAPAPFIEGPEA